MTNYKLTYFDFDGGRAEPVRIAFHHGGIEFEDVRISFEEFMKTRESTRFNSVPTLAIDGKIVTQTNAMLRFIGKKVGLYPALSARDSILCTVQTYGSSIVPDLTASCCDAEAASSSGIKFYKQP